MHPIGFQHAQVNGIRMRWAECGSGPLVLLCHGWPESWYSWRAQMLALAQAGYRAVAPDMRGYGDTEAPAAVERYTMLHLVGDMVELLQALQAERALIVGHDWGAAVAWHAALLRPQRFVAVAGMSVPYTPPARVDLLSALRQRGVDNFYMQYFQAEGVAEAELQRDVAAAIRRIHFSASGDGPSAAAFGLLPPGGGLLDNTVDPARLPHWMDEADLAHYAAEFTRSGFRGGLNWYRNFERNCELLAPWRGCAISQPALFIAGTRDPTLAFPAARQQIERFAHTLPALRGCHLLDGAGHWVQRERAEAVNRLLLEFAAAVWPPT